MPRPLPDRYRRLAPLVLRLLPFAAAAVTLMLVAGRHDRLADSRPELQEQLRQGGLVVLLADACVGPGDMSVARTVASGNCPGADEVQPYLADFSVDRSQAAERTRALRALVASWRGPGNLLVATHRANVTALTELVPVPGEAVIMRPVPSGGDVLGRLQADPLPTS